MKKTLFTIALISLITLSKHLKSQSKDYSNGLGLHFGTMQYKGDLGNEMFTTDDLHPAVGLSYNHYINPSLDAHLLFAHGQIDYTGSAPAAGPLTLPAVYSFKTKLYDINLMLRYKFNNGYMLKEDSRIAPFIQGGFGDAISTASHYANNSLMDFNFPIGAGINFGVTEKLSVVVQSTYNFTLTDNYDSYNVSQTGFDDFLFTSVGVNFSFNTIKDADRDGVADELDACPNVKGSKDAMGCPDNDGDGVANKDDKCPNLKGILANKGCPKIDKDDIKIMNMAMKGLFFETGSSKIKESSYPVLDQVVAVMNRHNEYDLMIAGHTDNTGSADGNLKLSAERAAAAKEYIISKGIDGARIISEGFGQTKPVASNDTDEGKALNRRVEFRIKF